ncbi:hypothetical protein Q8A73_005742 [Channa argus]|nr:hypothetical protein Q8A73_005742 [Channa argus]
MGTRVLRTENGAIIAVVSGPQCRFAVGSILSEGENKPDAELLKRYETSGFNVFSFPEITHVVTTSFPNKTFISILLRLRKVYPQLHHYIKERRLCAHPFLEIYREGEIQFMAPLARQGDFYVPELWQLNRRLSEKEESHSDTDVSDLHKLSHSGVKHKRFDKSSTLYVPQNPETCKRFPSVDATEAFKRWRLGYPSSVPVPGSVPVSGPTTTANFVPLPERVLAATSVLLPERVDAATSVLRWEWANAASGSEGPT